MKKISLLFVMLLAFTVSTTAQSLPKPANPEISEFIDYGAFFDLWYSFATDWDGSSWQLIDVDGNYLDSEKVSFSVFTDNDQVFTFTPDMFPGEITESMTQVPYSVRTPNGSIGYWCISFDGLTTIGDDPFFTWRIGLQTIYTDGDQTSASDIVYMEVYPQLQEAKNVTSTSFLADWSCEAENTFIINNFIGNGCGYFLYVVDKESQEVVLTENVDPADPNKLLPGATCNVEGLTPGKTYQFYVVVKQNTGMSYQSVVREVTLPETVYMLGGDDQNWNCTEGTEFDYNAENKNYTATITFSAEFNYFGFTTRLAENNDDGGWAYIEPFRFGAVSEGDFIYDDSYNGQPLSLTWDAYKAFRIPAGEYKLTVDLTSMKLIIEKVVPPHGYDLGDVNHDHAVNIGDVTALIDHLLGVSTVCQICADVNGDTVVNIGDVTALIDVLLGVN